MEPMWLLVLHPKHILEDSLPLLFPAFRGSHFRHHVYVLSDARDPSSERWNCGRERCPVVILSKFRFSRKSTTWDRRLYFPSEGRRAEDCFALKIRRLRPGLNPRTWVPKASTLPLDHRSRLFILIVKKKSTSKFSLPPHLEMLN